MKRVWIFFLSLMSLLLAPNAEAGRYQRETFPSERRLTGVSADGLSFQLTYTLYRRSSNPRHRHRRIRSSRTQTIQQHAYLEPFRSDECTYYFEGEWAHCCVNHDMQYWLGGSKEDRKASDKQLRQCVEDSGHSFNAYLMYWGVRIGGNPSFRASYRWGYGWNYMRGYFPLLEEEKELAEDQLGPNSLSP